MWSFAILPIKIHTITHIDIRVCWIFALLALNLTVPHTYARIKFADFCNTITYYTQHNINVLFLNISNNLIHTFTHTYLLWYGYTIHISNVFFCSTFARTKSRWERSKRCKNVYNIVRKLLSMRENIRSSSRSPISLYVCANWISRFTHNRIVGGISHSFQRQPFAHILTHFAWAKSFDGVRCKAWQQPFRQIEIYVNGDLRYVRKFSIDFLRGSMLPFVLNNTRVLAICKRKVTHLLVL